MPRRSSRNLVVFDLDGNCVGTTDFARRSINVRDRQVFQQSVATRQLAIDGPIAARGTGEIVVVLARPVERQGKVTGVIAASVAISHLDQLLDVKGVLSAGAVVVVTTRAGVVLKQLGTSSASGRVFAPDEVAALAQTRSGSFDSALLDGVAPLGGEAANSAAA